MKSRFFTNLGMLSLILILVGLSTNASAKDLVLPAGTILQCTINEPNFSSATAEVGDPVLCHLKGVAEFGEQVFPRGSYLVGHLESAKDPGHFFGKGNLKLQFDRIGLPTGDLPLDGKLIAVRGYKVDREGKIDGKGHAKRDVAEWMLPPLWPWKVIMLPARGPRPKLKGETTLSLRLMDDVQIPQTTQTSSRGPTNVLPRSAVRGVPSRDMEILNDAQTLGPGWHYFGRPQDESLHDPPHNGLGSGDPRLDDQIPVQTPKVSYATYMSQSSAVPVDKISSGISLFVMKTGAVIALGDFTYRNGSIAYRMANGERGIIGAGEVDWMATTRVNAERGRRITLRNGCGWCLDRR